MKKEGEGGRRKITQYTRYRTLDWPNRWYCCCFESSPGLVHDPGFGFRMTAAVSLTAGTMFLMVG
jgi:preprotein translocase subunit SecY